MKNLIKVVLTSFLLVCGITFGVVSEATETDQSKTVEIELYKLLFEMDKLPEETINDGVTNPFEFPGSSFLKKYQGLNGVTYSAFDVTDDFYALLKTQKSPVEAQRSLAGQSTATKSPIITTTTATIHNQAGVALFNLPVFDSQNRYRAYIFKEVSTSVYYEAPSAPLVVVLPVVNQEGQPLEVIRLFPKQIGRSYSPPTLTKDISKEVVSYGEIIDYQLRSKVPGDVWKYKKYVIKDKADEHLIMHQESLKMTIEGQELAEDSYTLATNENGFEISFNPFEMQKYAAQELTIDYEMHLTAGAEADRSFINQATLETDKDFIERKQKVKTGGFHFIKVDRHNEEDVLDGATFLIRNKKDEYLTQVGDEYEWIDLTVDEFINFEETDSMALVSNEEGIFEIAGLAYGDYELVEVKAPEGYILSKTTIPFTVDEGTWQLGDFLVAPLKVINEPITETPTKPKKPQQPTKPPKPINPTPPLKPSNPTTPTSPLLPKTGASNTVSYSVLGLLILGVSYLLHRTRQRSLREKGE